MKLGNNLWEYNGINSRHQVEDIRLGTASQLSDRLRLQFEYGSGNTNNGNVRKQTVTPTGIGNLFTVYTYVGVIRLKTAVDASRWSRVYGYDDYGNRWIESTNRPADLTYATPTAQSQFDAATNRLTNAGNGDELPSDAYDDAGNLAKHPWVGAMVYDANSLQARFCTGITQPCTDQSAAARYEYDGDGRRVKKHLSATHTIVFVYDAFGNLAAEYDTEPAPNLLAGTYYRTTDHLGSTRLMTDATAKVVSRHDYFPFGEEIPANSGHGNRQLVTDANPTTTTYNQDFGVYQKFTGKERDTESSLDYLALRKNVAQAPYSLGWSLGRDWAKLASC
jgi:YD repeat-containing protein